MTDSEKIEILIDQVGRLSESITAMRMGISEMRVSIESGFRDLKAVSERQEQNIDRSVGIVETLIQPQRSQG